MNHNVDESKSRVAHVISDHFKQQYTIDSDVKCVKEGSQEKYVIEW